MLEPTSGSVWIEGLDIQESPSEARELLGFCPQYGERDHPSSINRSISFMGILDILYDELTVEEHLELIGRVGFGKRA